MSNTNIDVAIGIDNGNGYEKAKAKIGDVEIQVDMPACVAGLVAGLNVKDTPSDAYMDTIFNRMICQFNSHLVKSNRFFAFGNSAIASSHHLTEFDINDKNLSKAQQELSTLLTLGTIAGCVLKDYWDKNNQLPEDVLKVNATAALALPIDEFLIHRESFSQKFCQAVHEVTISNFEQNVHIQITFSNKVIILPEGVSAQHAIQTHGVKLVEAMLADMRSRNFDLPTSLTAEKILKFKNTLGIDIGEGTTNLAVIIDGVYNQFLSSTLQKGFGTMVEQALPAIQRANLPFSTRKSVINFLMKQDNDFNEFNESRKRTIIDIINEESIDLVDAICSKVSQILNTENIIEAIFVYGGGSTPLKELLYDKLFAKTQTVDGGVAIPILYLDSSYARHLNRAGLYDEAIAAYKKSQKAKIA